MLAAIGISFPKTANAVIPVEDIPLTAVAVTIARKEKMVSKHFLVPVFDASWHYDS